MPELPEVQTIADDLNRKVVGRKIINFWTDWPKSVKLPTAAKLKSRIKGTKILKVERVGKNVLIHLDKDRTILVHQKMTGHLMVGRWAVKKKRMGWDVIALDEGPLKERVNQFIHAIFYLDNGQMIALSDMRKFARIAFGTTKEIVALPDIAKLGPDALDPRLTAKKFGKIISSRKKTIKQTLMDPLVVAGIGNIYADDILWAAKIHPLRRSDSLSEVELKNIFKETRRILKRGVRTRGASVGDYRDTAGERGGYGKHILVYRRTGEPCNRCRTSIKRTRIGQRSAHFCPKCQKEMPPARG